MRTYHYLARYNKRLLARYNTRLLARYNTRVLARYYLLAGYNEEYLTNT